MTAPQITPKIIAQVIAAVNGGKTDAFLDLFATEGAVDDWGSVYRGRAEIKDWSDRELIGVHAHFTLQSAEQHGDKASMMVMVGGQGFTGPSRFVFTLAGDRIQRMQITGS
jgi:hypothetical protein